MQRLRDFVMERKEEHRLKLRGKHVLPADPSRGFVVRFWGDKYSANNPKSASGRARALRYKLSKYEKKIKLRKALYMYVLARGKKRPLIELHVEPILKKRSENG